MLLQNYIILNTKDYFPCAFTATNMDKDIAFWRSRKFREGLCFLFPSKMLINSASLYWSLVSFDTEESHTVWIKINTESKQQLCIYNVEAKQGRFSKLENKSSAVCHFLLFGQFLKLVLLTEVAGWPRLDL